MRTKCMRCYHNMQKYTKYRKLYYLDVEKDFYSNSNLKNMSLRKNSQRIYNNNQLQNFTLK